MMRRQGMGNAKSNWHYQNAIARQQKQIDQHNRMQIFLADWNELMAEQDAKVAGVYQSKAKASQQHVQDFTDHLLKTRKSCEH